MTLEEQIQGLTWGEVVSVLVRRLDVLTRLETIRMDMDDAIESRCGPEEYGALDAERDELREKLWGEEHSRVSQEEEGKAVKDDYPWDQEPEGDEEDDEEARVVVFDGGLAFVPKAKLDAAEKRAKELERQVCGALDWSYQPMHKDQWKESFWRSRPLTELSREELMDALVELPTLTFRADGSPLAPTKGKVGPCSGDDIASFCSEFDLMRDHLTDDQLANVLARYGYVPKAERADAKPNIIDVLAGLGNDFVGWSPELEPWFSALEEMAACLSQEQLAYMIFTRTGFVPKAELDAAEKRCKELMGKLYGTSDTPPVQPYHPMYAEQWGGSLWRGRPITELTREELMDALVVVPTLTFRADGSAKEAAEKGLEFVLKTNLDAAEKRAECFKTEAFEQKQRLAEERRFNLGLANESQEYQERLRVAKKRIEELCEEQRKTASFWERIRIKAATESNARIHELEAQLAERDADAEVGKALRELRPNRDSDTISFWLRWEQADDPPKYAGVEYDYHGSRCGISGCASLLTAIRAYNERGG